MQIIYKNKDGQLISVGTPNKPRTKKKHKEDNEKVSLYLEFRFCKDKCFNCKRCNYFWGQEIDKEELRGKPAHFGVK